MASDNNNVRHSPIPFEEAFAPKSWESRCFGFITALSLANAFEAYNYFHRGPDDKLSNAEHRRMLARELIAKYFKPAHTEPGQPDTPIVEPGTLHNICKIPKGRTKWDVVGKTWGQPRNIWSSGVNQGSKRNIQI